MGLVQDRIKRLASLARLGFDEVAIDPPWHDLDEARSVIAECLAAAGLAAGERRPLPRHDLRRKSGSRGAGVTSRRATRSIYAGGRPSKRRWGRGREWAPSPPSKSCTARQSRLRWRGAWRVMHQEPCVVRLRARTWRDVDALCSFPVTVTLSPQSRGLAQEQPKPRAQATRRRSHPPPLPAPFTEPPANPSRPAPQRTTYTTLPARSGVIDPLVTWRGG